MCGFLTMHRSSGREKGKKKGDFFEDYQHELLQQLSSFDCSMHLGPT